MNIENSDISELYEHFKTSEKGLSDAVAKEKIRVFGPNVIYKVKETQVILDLILRFNNPIIILLILTACVAFLLGETVNSLLILLMVVLSVLLSFYQEQSANRAAKRLRELIELKSVVIRSGIEKRIRNSSLVPGDIVHLKAGNLIPADGRLIYANNLFVNQSILTGESFPVEKKTSISLPQETPDYPTHMLYMGTSVISGEGIMLTCITGRKTALGLIGESLAQKPPATHFENESRRFGLFLMKVTFFLILFVLIANLFFFRPWLDTFLFALALAVGMTPEFLPMVMTVTLSRGAQLLSKKKVIVKRLSALHDLGAVDILCSDKTGTLTESKIQLKDYCDYEEEKNSQILKLAYLNSYFQSGYENPLDQAILNNAMEKPTEWKKINEVPFDFERKRISVLLRKGAEHILITKGSPSNIIDICTHYQSGDEIIPLHEKDKEKLQEMFENKTKMGLRALAVAWKKGQDKDLNVFNSEENCIFSGFLYFYDPPKRGVAPTIKKLQELGININILTGDNKGVATHLCQELNLTVKGVVTGQEIEKLSDLGFRKTVQESNIFCQVTPLQKRLIIDELKRLGFIVGFLGDGINDAPSLYNAHVGISVDSAVDVAKEAADLILMEKSLSIIVEAIIEGRRIFANIIKYIKMMTSSNFGNMCSMAAAALFIPFLPMLPAQILLNNFLYDLSQTVLPFDNVDKEQTTRPETWNLTYLFKFMMVMGPLSSIFDFLFFFIMLGILKTSPGLFQTGWFMESLATQILIIFVIRTRQSILKSTPHRFLIVMALVLVGVGISLPYINFIASYLSFVKPPLYFLGIITLIVFLYILSAEKIKRFVK